MKSDIKDKVKSLYDIMKEEKIQELEVNSKDFNVAIKRKNPKGQPVFEQVVQTVQKSTVVENVNLEDKVEEEIPAGETIKSPITGVFYRSSSPSTPPLVAEGDIVDIGKTLCIVEAMKVMNEIKATAKVRILQAVAENGGAVNSGQDLFRVEKI